MQIQENVVSFVVIWSERRKGRITCVGCVCGERGLVRDRHLIPKESIIAAFEKLKINMQTLWMKHLIVLDISWIYSQQPLILKEEQTVLCQKLLITCFIAKLTSQWYPQITSALKQATCGITEEKRRLCLSGHTVLPERVFRSYNWFLLNTGAILQ